MSKAYDLDLADIEFEKHKSVNGSCRSAWWQNTSSKERGLCLCVCVLSALVAYIIGLSVVLYSTGVLTVARSTSGSQAPAAPLTDETNSEKAYEVCITPQCVDDAKRVMSWLDTRVDPCQDFYQFACGRWHLDAENTLQPDRLLSDNMRTHRNDILEFLKDFLEAAPTENDPEYVANPRALYQSCVDMPTRNAKGITPAANYIDQFGGIQLNASTSPGLSLTDLLGESQWLGVNPFFRFAMLPDGHNASRYAVILLPPKRSLLSEQIAEPSDNRSQALSQLFVMNQATRVLREYYNGSIPEPDLKTLSSEVFVLHKHVIKYGIDSSDTTQELDAAWDTRLSLRELEKDVITSVNLTHLLTLLLPDERVTPDLKIAVSSVNKLKAIDKLLKTMDKRVLKNYVLYNIMLDLLPYLSQSLTMISEAVLIVPEDKPVWVTCIENTELAFPEAMGALLVNHFIEDSPQVKQQVHDIVDSLMSAFNARLDKSTWLDDVTKHSAKLKAAKMGRLVAFPEIVTNISLLTDLVNQVNMTSDYIGNLVQVNYQSFQRYLLFGQGTEADTTWPIISKVNAYYNVAANQIAIISGILTGIYFQADRQRYMNYGTIGSVVGHEVTHAFDWEGRMRDHSGSLIQWWSNHSQTAFERKSHCFRQQFSDMELTHPEINKTFTVDGNRTLSENLADSGGLTLAYLAYSDYTRKHGPEPRLPGLVNITGQQLLFISTAQLWCTTYTPRAFRLVVNGDDHSPPMSRVRGMMMNSPEFAQSFDCPLNSPMNPAEKCSLW